MPVDPPIGPSENPLSEGAVRRRAVFPSRDDAYANYASKPPLNVLRPDVLRAYVEHGFADLADGGVTLKCRPEDEAQIYRMGSAHGANGASQDIRVTERCPMKATPPRAAPRTSSR